MIGTATTGSDGSYSITPTATCTSPVEIVLTPKAGTKMLDEATGTSVDLPAGFALRAYIANPGTTLTANITPFTDMAASVINASSSVPSTANVGAAITAVITSVLGGDDQLYNAKPMTPASAVASTDPEVQKLSALMTAISVGANKLLVNAASGATDTGMATLMTLKGLQNAAKATISISASGVVSTNAPISGASAPVDILNQDKTDSSNTNYNKDPAAQSIATTPTTLPAAPTVTTTVTAPTPGIATAKTLFASLHSSLILLSNPSQTGFLDVEMAAAKTDLQNTSLDLGSVSRKLRVMNNSFNLLNTIKSNGIANLPVCTTPGANSPCRTISGSNTAIQTFSYNGSPEICNTNSLSTSSFVPGTMPPGIKVTCQSYTDQSINTATTSTGYQFNSVVTPTSATSYSFSTYSKSQTYTYLTSSYGNPTTGQTYSGTATVAPFTTGPVTTVAVNGQIAAGASLDTVAITLTRTYPYGTTPAGAPSGYALANFAFTGNVTNTSTSTSASLLPGTFATVLEDTNGSNYLLTNAQIDPSMTLAIVAQIKTAKTQIDGSITAGSVVCDKSSTACIPGTLTFTGSLTDLATAGVGKFFTGTVTNTTDFSSYDNSKVTSSSNYIKDSAILSGSVINNTVSPSMTYAINVTANVNKPAYTQGDLTIIYTDPSKNTVTITAAKPGTTLTATSGGVTVVWTQGTGGTVSVSQTQIGTISGSTVHYTDGTFDTLN